MKPICLTRHGANFSSASKYRQGTIGSEEEENLSENVNKKNRRKKDTTWFKYSIEKVHDLRFFAIQSVIIYPKQSNKKIASRYRGLDFIT